MTIPTNISTVYINHQIIQGPWTKVDGGNQTVDEPGFEFGFNHDNGPLNVFEFFITFFDLRLLKR